MMKNWILIIVISISPYLNLAQLTGSYTIGGASPDFAALQDAIDSLNAVGVSGAVTFNIRTGTYLERLMITEIAGASAINTITFQSEGNDSTLVVIQQTTNPSDSNYVVFLNGADYITLKHITFKSPQSFLSGIILIDSGAHHNSILNNVLLGDSSGSSSFSSTSLYSPNGSHDTANIISNNYFYAGGNQIVYYGESSTKLESGTEITGNIFKGTRYSGAYIYYQDSLLFNSNNLNSSDVQVSFSGFSLNYCDNGTRILNNTLVVNGDVNMGFFLRNCDASSSSMILMANNVISMGGTGSATGVYINTCTYVKFHNNSINMHYSEESSTFGISGSGHSVMNNIFVNNDYIMSLQPGKVDTMDYNCYYTTASYFAYYAGDSIYTFSQWQDSTNQDANSIFADPFFYSDTDLHVTNPLLNAAAVPTVGVTVDMDGDARNGVTPDIGADEFTPQSNDAGLISFDGPVQPLCIDSSDVLVTLMNFGTAVLTAVDIEWSVNGTPQTTFNWTGALASSDTEQVNIGNYTFTANTSHDIKIWTANPNGGADVVNANDTILENSFHTALNGIYTVGGTLPDFNSLSDVADNLNYGGICGPVTFNIRTGSYDVQVRLAEIEGSSAINTITFQSESGDSSDVLIHHLNTTSATNYVFYLEGTDYVTIKNLSLQADSGSINQARILVFDNNATHGNLMNCELTGKTATFNSTGLILIYSISHNDSNWTISNNKLHNGSNAISLKGESSSHETNLKIENNEMDGQYGRCIFLMYQNAPIIKGNSIDGMGSIDYSIYMSTNSNNTKITGNHIWTDRKGALYLNNVDGTVSKRALIANNFFTLSGTSSGSCIYSRFSDYLNIYHNSVNVTNVDLNTESIYLNNGTSAKILNNIFSNTGGGYAIYVNTPALIDTCDHNDLYTTGTNLGYWSGNITSLNTWQIASGQDSFSLSIDPAFISSTNLHTSESVLDSAGIPVIEVTYDYDNELRNLSFPDIGADEFEIAYNDANIVSIDSPATPLCDTTSSVIITLRNNGISNLVSTDIKWTINGVPQTTFNWTGNLIQGSSEQVTIGSMNINFNTSYDLVIWSENPNGSGDANLLNDTASLINFYKAILSGTYTIGGTSPDFADFNTAVTNLTNGGICGPVVFEARDGTYNENIKLVPVDGVSDTNTIRFTSESGDSSLVILTFASNGVYIPTIQLDGGDHFIFDHLTLEATGTDYGKVIELFNEASFNTFQNNRIMGKDTFLVSSDWYVVSSLINSYDSVNVFRNNFISGGSNGLTLYGKSSTEHASGIKIENNTFGNSVRYSIYVSYLEGVEIFDNMINGINLSSFTIGMYLSNVLFPNVQRNKLSIDGSGNAIDFWRVSGSLAQPALFANNFVQIGTTYESRGINVGRWNNHVNIFHNSINVTSTDTTSTALYINNDNTDSIKIFNNIFVNSNGNAIYFYDTTNNPQLDHNSYLSTIPFAYWGGVDIDSLDDWVLVSKMDSNSLYVDPLFTDSVDLHASECLIDGAGISLTGITYDIDGDLRNTLTPDIGADEFGLSPLDTLFIGNDTTFCKGDSVQLEADSGFVGYLWDDSSTTLTHTAKGGTHWVSAYDACNNTISDTILITESSPIINIGNDTTICEGDSLPLDAGAGFNSYLWNQGATTQSISVMAPMIYSVSVSDSNGCIGTDSMTLATHTLPEVNLGADTTVKSSITLDAGSGFASYLWSDGSSMQTLEVSTSGEYSVTVTDGFGCTGSDMINVTIVSGIGYPGQKSKIKIYPNPSSGSFVVDMSREGDYILVMKDMLGRVIYKRQFKGSRVQLNMELKAGIYFAEFQRDDGRWVIPLIISDQ